MTTALQHAKLSFLGFQLSDLGYQVYYGPPINTETGDCLRVYVCQGDDILCALNAQGNGELVSVVTDPRDDGNPAVAQAVKAVTGIMTSIHAELFKLEAQLLQRHQDAGQPEIAFNRLTPELLHDLEAALHTRYRLGPYNFEGRSTTPTSAEKSWCLDLQGTTIMALPMQHLESSLSAVQHYAFEATLLRLLKGILIYNGLHLRPVEMLPRPLIHLVQDFLMDSQYRVTRHIWHRVDSIWPTKGTDDVEVPEAVVIPLVKDHTSPGGHEIVAQSSELMALISGMITGYKVATGTGLADFTPTWQDPDVFGKFNIPAGGWP